MLPILRESMIPLHVLVVDDDVDAAEAVAALLELQGHRPALLHDGLGVLEAARSVVPDVIVMDLGLPGINGYEAAGLLRQERSLDGVLLVALTGWGSEAHKRASLDAGFDLHLTKPVTYADLFDTLAKVEPHRLGVPTI
jgi:CheY-like chemotaxis protein